MIYGVTVQIPDLVSLAAHDMIALKLIQITNSLNIHPPLCDFGISSLHFSIRLQFKTVSLCIGQGTHISVPSTAEIISRRTSALWTADSPCQKMPKIACQPLHRHQSILRKKTKYCPMHANLSKLNQIRSAFSFHQDLKQINGRITCKIDIHCPDVMILLDASIIMCQCSIWPKRNQVESALHKCDPNVFSR